MDCLRVPREVSLGEIRDRDASWSPSMFRRVIIPNPNVKLVGDLLDSWCNGTEVGSISYVDKSPFSFIRTKALQDHSALTQPKGGSIIPIIPKAFAKAIQNHPRRVVRDGDILYARGGSVGEVAFAHACGQAVMSGHMLKIVFKENPFYCFAFMKHPLCKLQQASNIKGAIRALDNFNINTLLDCLIPFPNQAGADRVIRYVSVLMQTIVEKEKTIREKNEQIDSVIEEELVSKQKPGSPYTYAYPSISEVAELGRLDASMYSEGFSKKAFVVRNYTHGWQTYEDMGFDIGRGQNLQISCIGKSIYSDSQKTGFYRLAAPTDFSEFRTIQKYRYLGSKKELAQVRKGDVIFGAEGFCKGRAVILADDVRRTITNIHGVVFHPRDHDMLKGIFFGCFLGYLRSIGLVDAIGAGGSGGSLAIGYFNHVPIPKFPEDKQKEIARLYHHDAPQPPVKPTLDTFVDWHRQWNAGLGIWELDREMKALQGTLSQVQEQIIEGKTVKVPLNGA